MSKLNIIKIFNNDKKSIIVLCYLAVILNIVTLTTITTSNSKYITDNSSFNDAIGFTNKFYKLSSNASDYSINIKSQTVDKLDINLSFKRNLITQGDEKENYTIEVPDACVIDSISETGSPKGKLKNNVLSYSSAGESSISLTISCDVKQLPIENSTISVPISVIEKVENDFASITYLKGTISTQVIEETSNRIEISKESLDIYKELKEKVEKIYFPGYVDGQYNNLYVTLIKNAILANENAYLNYFKNIKTAEQLTNLLKGKNYLEERPGINIEINENKIIFDFTDEFIGYALTYTEDKNNKVMYFTYDSSASQGNQIAQIRDIFNNYLKYYYNNNEIDAINSYLADKKLEHYILELKNEDGNIDVTHILGLYKDPRDNNLIRLVVKSLLDIATSESSSPIVLEPSSPRLQQQNFINSFNECVSSGICKEWNLKESTVNVIRNNSNLRKSYTKNTSTSAEYINYNDYFVVDGLYLDEANGNILHQYVAIHVSSKGEEANGVTLIDFKLIEDSDLITYNLTKLTDSSFNLEIGFTNKAIENKETVIDEY